MLRGKQSGGRGRAERVTGHRLYAYFGETL